MVDTARWPELDPERVSPKKLFWRTLERLDPANWEIKTGGQIRTFDERCPVCAVTNFLCGTNFYFSAGEAGLHLKLSLKFLYDVTYAADNFYIVRRFSFQRLRVWWYRRKMLKILMLPR